MDKKKLLEALKQNRLYDFIANEYPNCSKEELKEIILSILGVCYDKCCGDEDEEALMELITEELEDRDFFPEE